MSNEYRYKYKNKLFYPDINDIKLSKDVVKRKEAIDETPLTKSQRAKAEKELEEYCMVILENCKEKYYKEDARLRDDFQKEMEEVCGFMHLPEEAKSAIHSYAWERGHSGGYDEVHNSYYDIVEFAEKIIKSCKP